MIFSSICYFSPYFLYQFSPKHEKVLQIIFFLKVVTILPFKPIINSPNLQH